MSIETLRVAKEKVTNFDKLRIQTQERILAELGKADLNRFADKPASSEPPQMGLYRAFKQFARGGVIGAEQIQALLGNAVEKQQEVETLLFWGASDKPSLGANDYRFINKLHNLRESVEQIYPPGLAVNVIFADYHVISNGYGNQETAQLIPEAQGYLNQARDALQEMGFGSNRFFWLSELYSKYGFPYHVDMSGITQSSLSYQVFLANREYLEANAQNYSRSANGDTELAAVLYVERRIREKGLLQAEFPSTILIASGIKKAARDIILPDAMPGVFFGDHAPWFQKDQI
ncbi:hypothetical protein HYT74_02330 [Candidatus Daviesbacteria bacterium]|nr:hypothetical protein [Candidatus Daviesbacteria bacterium]